MQDHLRDKLAARSVETRGTMNDAAIAWAQCADGTTQEVDARKAARAAAVAHVEAEYLREVAEYQRREATFRSAIASAIKYDGQDLLLKSKTKRACQEKAAALAAEGFPVREAQPLDKQPDASIDLGPEDDMDRFERAIDKVVAALNGIASALRARGGGDGQA